MPLSALHTIDIQALYWHGWLDYLTHLPSYLTSSRLPLSQDKITQQNHSSYPSQTDNQAVSTIIDKQPTLDDHNVPAEGKVAYFLNQIAPAYFTQVLGKSFVAQSSLPTNFAYESFIFEQHKIPTRDGLHDFFNGLCWFLFPRTKQVFNQLHQQQIQQLGSTQRGRIRDRLTIMDENGFLISCPDALWEALVRKNWLQAFVELRHLWQQSKVMVFGHALLEKLVNPYKAITAHAIRIPLEVVAPMPLGGDDAPHSYTPQDITALDHYLSHWLNEKSLQEKPYIPLQIFGIPAWSSEVQDLNFYQDKTVFR